MGKYLPKREIKNEELEKEYKLESGYIEKRTGIDKNNSNYSVDLSGKEGETVTVTVTINDPNEGEIYRSSKDVVFGSQDTINFN